MAGFTKRLLRYTLEITMTKEEKKEFLMKHWGEKMEFRNSEGEVWARYTFEGISSIDSDCDFIAYVEEDDEIMTFSYCRPIPKKKTRLRTLKEIWGKTLINEDGIAWFVDSTSMIVESYHKDGFKVNMQNELDYENAESLEVEEDE